MKNIIINNHLRLIILIALYALLLNISQNSYASIFFINIKDEIGSGYKQQKLFKSLDKKEKLIRIEKIGNKLSKVSRKRNGIDYIFNLISDENAYSGFAGFIYVGEPFYDMVTDDDELAFIIAHEMAHSDNRDTADSIEQMFAQRFKDDTNISISEEMLSGYFFNRIQEYRADSHAVLYLYLAGYDPNAGIRVMDKFQKKHGLYPPGLEKVAGHPSYVNRKRNIESFIKEMNYIKKFYYEDALSYLKNKDYNNALVFFSNYLGLFYNSSEAYFNRGLAYLFDSLDQNDINELFWDYQIKFDPDVSISLSEKKNKVSLLKSRNDLEKAITFADNKEEIYLLLGVLNAELGDYDNSLEYLNKSIKYEKYNCASVVNIGLIYYKKGDSNKALNHLKKSTADCPDNSVLHFNLAQMVFLKGDKNRAKEYFNKVIKLNNNKMLVDISKKRIQTIK